MAGVLSRGQAEDLVKGIAREHGYISPEFFQKFNPSDRRVIQEAMFNKDLLIGSSVMTLAKNLYTTKARFVYELLQNADDNHYRQARDAGAPPHVSFQVYHDRIVIDCNEDGFTSENLTAICAVGKSSKHGVQGYIGEKGIGFKSVFMVAWKVHIQSGPFSFSFTHRSGDSGMGMISPVWETGHDELVSPLTRITLYLHDSGDADLLERTQQSTRAQFAELQETSLLFLKNIDKLDILFYDVGGILTSSTTYSVSRPTTTDAILQKTQVANGSTREMTSHFRVATHQVTNLARNENRSYSDEDIDARLYATSTVVVAFPMTDTGVPIVGPQDLFAFLPVRHVGFNFLIQADFVTDASRQDIVSDSPRNIGLIRGIAKAFAKGIMQLSGSSGMEGCVYQWMRYLPQTTGQHRGDLWDKLVMCIGSELYGKAVLLGRKRPERRPIRDLLRLPTNCRDENGEPLFDDGQPEQIVSRKYQAKHLDILKDYGLAYAHTGNLDEWLEADLRRGVAGRMQSPTTTESWRTRAAKLLRQAFETSKISQSEMLNLKLLPLQDGTWAEPVVDAPSFGPKAIYFAQIGGLDIPLDVGLRLISPDVTNIERKTLFALLGVGEAPILSVQTSILKKYRNEADAISLAASKQHLRFLYLTDHLLPDGHRKDYSALRVVDQDGYLVPGVDAYKDDGEPYGAMELFKKTASGPNPGNGAPGYENSSFVNEEYFKESPSTPQKQELSWLDWFYHCVCVNSYVKLISEGEFLPPGSYVREHRPEKFLGALRVNYELSGGFDDDSIDLLRKTTVSCQGSASTELRCAYYPTTELLKRVGKLVEPGAFFPWLYLEDAGTQDAIPAGWKGFLTAIGIASPTDLDFSLAMLRYSQTGFPQTAMSSSRSRIFELYEHIFTRQGEASEDPEAATKVRNVFNEQKRIYVPTDAGGHTWAFPSECVWNAPQVLQTKYALRLLYEPCHREDKKDINALSGLFKNTLGIRDCSWETFIGELKGLKAVRCDDIATLVPIYKALNSQRRQLGHSAKAAIKLAFESNALIYAPSDDRTPWRNVAQCIWSTGAKLRGRVSLNDPYDSLQDFFVEFLGVKPVDLEMAITELKEAGAKTETSVKALKESIWTVNSLLLPMQRLPSSGDVVGSSIFPIKMPNGQITRGSAATEFSIVDRESLGQAFAENVKLLDFSLEEVSRLSSSGRSCRIGSCPSPSERSLRSVARRPDLSRGRTAKSGTELMPFSELPATSEALALYDILKGAEVYETSGISSNFQLTQDGATHVVLGDTTTLHVDKVPSGLKVYLPHNKDDQNFVFVTTLGEKLFEWMMQWPSTKTSVGLERGTKATQAVLMAPRSRTALVLEKNGIASLDDIEDTDEKADSETKSASSTPQLRAAAEVHPVGEGGRSDDSDIDDPETPARSVTSTRINCDDGDSNDAARSQLLSSGRPVTPASGQRQDAHAPHAAFSRLPITAPATPESDTTSRASDTAYAALLGRVIHATRNKTIPSTGSFGMSQLLTSVLAGGDAVVDSGLHVVSFFERDCRVGAAGELYVFELLSGLPERLPGFGRDNWQSNMRRYVTVHPKYADMAPWSGWETSDITYWDTESVLTSLLVQQGYLDRDAWSGEKPQYFIEVKTTTSHCETPFFMSKAQYKRMQDNTLTPENRSAIYIIFRVYNLGLANMGLAVYVDPEALRVASQLEFTGENWSVVPQQIV